MAEAKVLVMLAVAGYLALAALVWLAQEQLMFYPQPAGPRPTVPEGWSLEDVSLEARDGTRLAGVLALPGAARSPLVIYYGGNAEEVTQYAAAGQAHYGERAVLLVNYRGYGGSRGRPGEAAMVADATEILDWAARHPRIDAERIMLHGRSLGTGVAVQVAASRPVRCVALTSPFASALDVAREMYSWLPIGLLMRHRFDSAAHAPKLSVPLLVITGARDTLIAPRHSERLAALWAGPVQHVSLESAGHNDLHFEPRYATALREFIDRCH